MDLSVGIYRTRNEPQEIYFLLLLLIIIYAYSTRSSQAVS